MGLDDGKESFIPETYIYILWLYIPFCQVAPATIDGTFICIGHDAVCFLKEVVFKV